MRRLLRHLTTPLLCLLALLSTPILLASLILYPRSYRRADSFWANQFNHGHAAVSTRGHLMVLDTRYQPTAPFTVSAGLGCRIGFGAAYDPRPSFSDSSLPIENYYLLGFGYYSAGDFISHQRVFLLPFWFVLLASATPPVLLLFHLRRRRLRHRLAHNLCARCGYDLRASPGTCPECGTPGLDPCPSLIGPVPGLIDPPSRTWGHRRRVHSALVKCHPPRNLTFLLRHPNIVRTIMAWGISTTRSYKPGRK